MYTYKIHIFIGVYDIIIKYDKLYNTSIIFFDKITLKCLLLLIISFLEFFSTFSLVLINFYPIIILYQNIHKYFSIYL